jgi:hypothetical protein
MGPAKHDTGILTTQVRPSVKQCSYGERSRPTQMCLHFYTFRNNATHTNTHKIFTTTTTRLKVYKIIHAATRHQLAATFTSRRRSTNHDTWYQLIIWQTTRGYKLDCTMPQHLCETYVPLLQPHISRVQGLTPLGCNYTNYITGSFQPHLCESHLNVDKISVSGYTLRHMGSLTTRICSQSR